MSSPLVATRVSREDLERLDAEVARRGTTRSEVLRSLLARLGESDPEEVAS